MSGLMRIWRPESIRILLVPLLLMLSTSIAVSQTPDLDNETCLDCHEEMEQTIEGTPHQLSQAGEESRIRVACVDCHAGGETHIEDPQEDNIGNPARQNAIYAERSCSGCHPPHSQTHIAGFDPHLNEFISCSDCHKIHGNSEGQLIDEAGDFCGKCHIAIVSQFTRRSNHPLTDQAVTCMSCHDFTGENDVNLGHGNNANCYRCHPEQSGPYRYEHQAVSSFATEGEGCTMCHRPHGSPNDRLLTQPGDGLCRQCHGVPPLHLSLHGGVGTKFACMECHSQVHGSYDNQYFLDPQLGIRIGDQPGSCYCHDVNEF